MRKRAAIFLFFSYLLIQLGSAGWKFYIPLVHTVCSLIMENFDKENENKMTLHLSVKEYHSYKTGENEIQINGNFYDVEEIKLKGDRVTLIAAQDRSETNWMAFHHYIENNISKNKHSHPTDFNFQKWLYKIYIPTFYQPEHAFTDKEEIAYNSTSISFYKDIIPDNTHQPPNKIS